MTGRPPRQIQLERLTEAAFAPFGEVVAPAPERAPRRYLDSYGVAEPSIATRCWISTFAPEAEGEIAVTQLEAHPHSAQVFVALQPCRFVVVAAGAHAETGLPDPDTCRAFVAEAASGVIYRPGVWHAGMMVLDTVSSFLVVQGLVAEGNDLFAPLPAPLRIAAAPRPQQAGHQHRSFIPPTGGD